MDISVGQVSGIIAAAVFIVQFAFPNALVVVLACVVGTQHSAVTWSVVQRQLGNSVWPTFLGSDTAANRGVYPKVSGLALLRPIGVVLIAIAAVVTPLGLYDAVVPEKQMQEVLFTYLQDTGPMGYGTPPQGSDIYINRECGGYGGWSNCPGGPNEEITTTYDEDGFPMSTEPVHTYNITIPQKQRDLYSSGLSKFSKTVSSFFDIKSRQYTWRTDPDKNDGKPFPVDTFRMLNSFILDDKVEPVQGLVIDMVSGGIGFRNHTLPVSVNQAAEWNEDLLWMEPMTECVDTNLTLEFVLPDGEYMTRLYLKNLSIIDNGGFANLIQEYPRITMDDNQNNPKLKERAYKAAWLVNSYTALIMNVTRPSPDAFAYLNSELGKKFPLAEQSSWAGPNGIAMDSAFYNMVNPSSNTLTTTNSSYTNTTYTTGLYENPFGISTGNYTDIQTLCQGAGQADWANSSNIQVQCGLFFAAASRADGVESLVMEPNSTWHQSVYACATLNKVSIKNVAFRYNATLGTNLNSLAVVNVTEKTYADEKAMPLWGVEQPAEEFRISDINQFWGMVSDDFDPSTAKANNVALKRAKELYLPGYTWGTGLQLHYSGYEYLPAAAAPKDILASAYAVGEAATSDTPYDYTGGTNLALFQRWQTLSKNIADVPRIIGLVWTDLAANTLQGARGWEIQTDGQPTNLAKRADQSSASSGSDGTLVPVLLYRKRVQYRWAYAIPAFAALAMFALISTAAVMFSLLRSGVARMRYYLERLSAGRLLAAQHYPGQCEHGAPTQLWISKVGRGIIDVAVDPIVAGAAGKRGEVMFYGGKPGVNESTVELHNAGEAYPLTPLDRTTARGGNGYVKMQNE